MKALSILLFLFTITNYSQKHYTFDYLLEYDVSHFKDTTTKAIHHHFKGNIKNYRAYYLTNSKDNSYSAVITEKDSLHYRLQFKNKKGLLSNVVFLKSDLNIGEFINIDCKYVYGCRKPNKSKTKNYKFSTLKDILIDSISYKHYRLDPINKKKAKRKKMGSTVYFIDKSTDFHLPNIENHIAYEKWDYNNMTNGIVGESFYYNYKGKLCAHMKLIKYLKTDKKIVIQRDCDYPRKKITSGRTL